MLQISLRKFFLLLVLHVMIINFYQHPIEACKESVIMACVDNTTCTQTYGEVYNMLASQKNYYSIAQALYPAKKPSSFLVHVRLYGANGTENCTPAAYTWSMSCLYAAFPPNVLEILSWGAIIVTPRTQELNITIPPFCCNVSKENRVTMIDNVLAAVSNKFRFLFVTNSSMCFGPNCQPVVTCPVFFLLWFYSDLILKN